MICQPAPSSIDAMCDLIQDWADDYYSTKASYNVRDALRALRTVAGSQPLPGVAAEILCAVQELEISRGISRRIVNDRVNLIRRCCRWAASPPRRWLTTAQIEDLKLVEPLRRGRTQAPEGKGIDPVTWEQVAATMAHADLELAIAIELHWLTGMRPGELVNLQRSEINTSRPDTWLVQPAQHKTAHLGMHRTIVIGPMGVNLLRSWLKRLPVPQVRPKVFRWKTPNTYRQAIQKANSRAARHDQGFKTAGGAWTPAQIRHAFATRVWAEFGAETARILLGHRHVRTTEIYAAIDHVKAIDAARDKF